MIAVVVRRRGAGVLVVLLAAAAAVYWWSAVDFDAGRPDFYYLADAFLQGRTWLEQALGPHDVVIDGARVYVPFAPFPAFVLAPLVALVGPEAAADWEPIVNSLLAVAGLALLWRLAGRLGVASLADRTWLLVLFGFSTATWWVTMRGGVWHTGQLIASILTFLGLLEAFGRRRPLVMGLLAGAAFLTRATLLAALPYWGWRSLPGRVRSRLPAGLPHAIRVGARRAAWLALGFAPALAFALWYNAVRFGNPLESGYGIAALPPFLEARRELGVFSLAHLGMNLDYFLWHLGLPIPDVPVAQARRPGAVRLPDEPRAPAGDPGGLAEAGDDRPGAHGAPGPGPQPAVLRRRLVAVRLPLRARLDPLRDGALRHGRRAPRHRMGLAGADPLRGRRQPLRGVLELQPVEVRRARRRGCAGGRRDRGADCSTS